MGERGLKLDRKSVKQQNGPVAPYGGAWIETAAYSLRSSSRLVAPYGGAWIETPNCPPRSVR